MLRILNQYKIYFVVAALVLSHGTAIKYTAAYKDGQFAIKKNELYIAMQEQRDVYIKAAREQAQINEQEKAKEKSYVKTVYKAVKQAAADRPDDPDCYSDQQLHIINAIVAGKPVSAPRKPVDPVRDNGRKARVQEIVYDSLPPRYRLNLIEEVRQEILHARERLPDISEGDEIAMVLF